MIKTAKPGQVPEHCTLGVFVKLPRPGAVKTRLVPALGAAAAADLSEALVEAVLARTDPRGGEYERLVFYTPRDAAEAMRAWLPGGRLRHQSEGELGTRLADAFARAFARGAQRVAIVGSDVPGLSRPTIVSAFAALDRADVVLGPATDGGYYLVALREAHPELFRGVSWSTASVLAQTLELAARGGLSAATLAPLRDVDTLDDLRAEWPAISPLLEHRPGLRAAIERAFAARERAVSRRQ
jgi:rSAM/selenodomain-associated transferase 1